MNARELMNPAQLFLEISQDSLKANSGTAGFEFPLERLGEGRLTEACKSDLTVQLQRFINRKSWQPRARAYCAIGARGVSLRRLILPAGPSEELMRLLPLQIESEFPLPPEQLAWGYQALSERQPGAAGTGRTQELLVAAVKKESLEDYSSILVACGASPVFTLAALARSYLCPPSPGPYAVLNLDRNYSELITMDEGVPIAVRVLAWGRENLTGLGPKTRGNGRDEPVGLGVPTPQGASFGGSGEHLTEAAISEALEPLARLINGQAVGRRIYVMGIAGLQADLDFPVQLASRLGNGLQCQAVDFTPREGGSAAILGLQRALEREPGLPPLVLQVKQSNGKAQVNRLAPWKWGALALGLALLGLLLPYAEALTLKSHLANKLAAVKTDQGRLGTIDRELDFLQYLQQSEPPYLDALLVLAKAAPPGTRFDLVSMNRRGDVSIRGSLRDGQQVADLRSKLIDSGFFANVGIEEQAPTPDRQKVNVRLSAQWKPLGSRTAPSPEPARASSEPKTLPAQMTVGAPPDHVNTAPMAQPPASKSSRN